jgi:ankyrin repeat protein
MHHVDTYGQTAFFYSCREGHLDTCKLMLDCGIDVNHVDNEGVTPLFYSVRSGYVPLVRLMLARGAAVNHCDVRGVTAYQLARMTNSTKDMYDVLLKNGATRLEGEPSQRPKAKKLTQKEMRAEAKAARLAKEAIDKGEAEKAA